MRGRGATTRGIGGGVASGGGATLWYTQCVVHIVCGTHSVYGLHEGQGPRRHPLSQVLTHTFPTKKYALKPLGTYRGGGLAAMGLGQNSGEQ